MDKKEREKYKKVTKFPSELRLDPVSKDWVVIATGRGKRPETFKEEDSAIEEAPKSECPFCDIKDQASPAVVFSEGEEVDFSEGDNIPESWTTVSIPNLYPAFIPAKEVKKSVEDSHYEKMNAVGYHEVIITRDHEKSMGKSSPERIKEIIDVYHQRYLELKKEPFVKYISIFHNHGKEAGASIAHPHSQLITTPVIDHDLRVALDGARDYFEENGDCIYCEMNRWDEKIGKRIVFENDYFQVVCPFASKAAFEMIISPKNHSAYFAEVSEREKKALAEAFYQALRRLYVGLDNPAYNFYLHSAPSDGEKNDHYHWHWTILPKTATWAGFEMGAQMEISTIEPEEAAKYLRNQDIE